MRTRLVSILTFFSRPAVALGSAVLIAAVAVGVAWRTSSIIPTGRYVAAAEASITAQGGTTSNLSFQIPGQIVAIPVVIGQNVSVGATLISLDRASLLAARAGAAANVEAAQARLAALLAGTRPEQLAINQTAVTQAQNALASALQAAYTNADDAVHAKADQLFTNPRNASAQLTILVPDEMLVNRIQTERIALEPAFSAWNRALAAASSTPETAVLVSETNMKNVAAFLDDLTTGLAETQSGGSISAAALSGYQSSVNAGRLNVLAARSGLISADTAYKAAVGALTLAEAGATRNDIDAQQAVVDAAEAALAGINVSLRESTLTAPFAGTVTALNASLGQTVAPGQVVASLQSSGGSKASALVVPTSSIIENDGHAFVYVKDGSGAPVKTPVTTGLVGAHDTTEITSGLTAGQEVLTFGTGTAD
ncbi:MAG: hypothetical protein B7W98_00580 [Parcubacteria group bacterium 20-58-5]|nr:MAG: hypothetical protein B7W98_00580 [Parcubacteria group bacterium 20-58-5]OYV63743.1 MAG: hypothetical protein B7X03_00685 [Parcubacteria group bacterium 21-58-10]OYV83091.1 MAG: hypothetical protein B7W96_00735 [Parcubacteria group bacterium 37-58-5]HQT82725.1 hypothetical protein [Candidatus Paceibacterota bacterium]